MATLGNNVKVTVLKGLEALGNAAAGLGTTARQKLSEINVEARRGELRKQIPGVVLDLWKEGVELPEKLNAIVQELGELEEKLAAMRARPEEPAKEEPAAEEGEPEEQQETAEPETAQKAEDEAEAPQAEAWTEGLEKAAHCAGEVIGSAMDAVGSFMENAADKVGEAIESLKQQENEASAPQDDQPQENGDEQAVGDDSQQPQENGEDEGTGDNA